MVYNAMKLFMEINPQLFDDCSHDYTELQNSAESREQARKSKWDKLSEQANRMKSGLGAPATANAINSKFEPDTITQDSQKRLDALKLHDDAVNGNKPTSVRSNIALICPSHFVSASFCIFTSSHLLNELCLSLQ